MWTSLGLVRCLISLAREFEEPLIESEAIRREALHKQVRSGLKKKFGRGPVFGACFGS